MVAAIAAGLTLVGASGGCSPSGVTCSPDLHSLLDSTGVPSAACKSTEACVVTGASSGCAVCDPAQCLAKNSCVTGWARYEDSLKGDAATQTTACRLTCTAQTDCPFDYHCVAGGTSAGQTVGYCAKDRTPAFNATDFKPTTPGEAAGGAPWGNPCDPTKGYDTNADCDVNQQFWCYGTSPTDANAFCTQFKCADDADCPGGWWCATINDTPNVTTAKRTDWGKDGTITACLPRTYDLKPGSFCAPCKSDVDCPKNNSIAQHCVSADNNGGTELVCATECKTDDNCPLDYTCQDAGVGNNVCVPRAATCLGNQAFCSPCHSDADCDSIGGFCTQADYSTEHYCTLPSGVTCAVSNNMLTAQCPKTTGTPSNAGVSCSYNAINFPFPRNQCYGLVNFGTGSNAAQVGGCWTKH